MEAEFNRNMPAPSLTLEPDLGEPEVLAVAEETQMAEKQTAQPVLTPEEQ